MHVNANLSFPRGHEKKIRMGRCLAQTKYQNKKLQTTNGLPSVMILPLSSTYNHSFVRSFCGGLYPLGQVCVRSKVKENSMQV